MDSGHGIELTDKTLLDRIKPPTEWYYFFHTKAPLSKSSSTCFYIDTPPPQLYSDDNEALLSMRLQNFALQLKFLELIVESTKLAQKDMTKIKWSLKRNYKLSEKELGRKNEILTSVIPDITSALEDKAAMAEAYKSIQFFAKQNTLNNQAVQTYRVTLDK